MPRRTAEDIRNEQLKDPDIEKIIKSFEDPECQDFIKWTDRGYIMSGGVLYRYSPDEDAEEAQLVVPVHERELIMKELHDEPTAAHYGAERTLHRIAKRYYFTGMRRYVTDYVKRCPECQRYKSTNQKPAGLLQTPIYSQRFETLSIDLFGPLPETETGEKWIFIIEDTSTKWVELFPIKRATAEECARILIDEVFLRYGLPRQIISDNGVQFVSSIMQQICYCLNIKQTLIPIYHPAANMVERKNRDLKPRLAMLVKADHTAWKDKIPAVRFAMNSVWCETTGHTAAYLTFGRELRTLDDVQNDVRAVIQSDNFIPQITPYLERMANTWLEARDTNEVQQDRRNKYADATRRELTFKVGDQVLVKTHFLSDATKGTTSKFNPKRDGPYIIQRVVSPTSYAIGQENGPILGTYHVSSLTPYVGQPDDPPVRVLRRRGRPPKRNKQRPVDSSSGRSRNQGGRV